MRTLSLVGLVLAASGCAIVRPPPWPDADASDRVLRLLWRREMAVSFSMPYSPVERSAPALDPGGGRVFVGSSDEHLYALRAGDGSTIWRLKTQGAVGCEVAYDRATDTVFFGTDDGFVYAVEARDGHERWHTSAHGEVRRRPVLTAEALYVATGNGSVVALDRDSGRRLWVYRREPPEGFAVEGHAGLVLHGRRLFAGFADGAIVALDAAEGSALWERDTSQDVELPEEDNSLPLYLDVDTTPVVHGGLVYAASHAAGLYALDERGGGVRWRRDDLEGVSGIAIAGDELWVSRPKRVDVLEATSGTSRSRVSLPAQSLTPPIVVRDLVLVGAPAGPLFAISRGERTAATIVSPGDGFSAAPVASGRRAFALSNAGVLYSLEVL